MKWTRALSFSSSYDVSVFWYRVCVAISWEHFVVQLKELRPCNKCWKKLKLLLQIVYSLIVYHYLLIKTLSNAPKIEHFILSILHLYFLGTLKNVKARKMES